ncbi:hypothetical protein ACOMHN_001897 [Nucella lapillus]
MIATVGLFVGGVVLAVSVGLASVVVKAYASAPPLLLLIVRHLFDFLFALCEACCRVTFIVLLFLYNVTYQCLGSVLTVVPALYHAASVLVSFILWVCLHLTRGLLGLETKALNTLSWLIAMCGLFLYLETKYQDASMLLFLNRRPSLARFLHRHRQYGNDDDNEDDVDGAAPANDAAGMVQENQMLEIENRENENEENALEEADRNRVNIDNVQNDQRELDRDRAQHAPPPARRLDDGAEHAPPPARQLVDADDDSSDYELDPTLCSVCLHRARGAALFPCGHTQLCRVCARIIIAAHRPCPICQTPIQESRNVYV